jgi:hypothetical protein
METYETYRYIHAKSSWMSAREALQMVEKLAEMGSEDGNIDSYMRQGVYSDYLRTAGEPEFGTSDFIATVPMMYMIANSVELILKGYTYAAHPSDAPREPLKLDRMIKHFHEDFGGSDATENEATIQAFIRTYTEDEQLPQLFAKFMQANEMSMDALYQERRFLNNTSFYQVVERYQPYLYTWEEGKPFYQKILEDVQSVLPIIEEMQADINSDGIPGEKVKALQRQESL